MNKIEPSIVYLEVYQSSIIELQRTLFFGMGCQNSLQLQVTPQEPHKLPEEHKIRPKEITFETKEPIEEEKQNSKPKEVSQKNKGQSKKPEQNQVNNLSELKKKHKSECHLEEVTLADATNCPKQIISKKIGEKRESKILSDREIEKNNEKEIGPSLKSIDGNDFQEVVQSEVPQQEKQKSEIQISKRQKNQNEEVSKEAVDDKRVGDSKFELEPFVFEQWCQTEQEQKLSKTQRLKQLDQLQVRRQQIDDYLSTIWNYQKELVDDIIVKMEEKEQRLFRINQQATE